MVAIDLLISQIGVLIEQETIRHRKEWGCFMSLSNCAEMLYQLKQVEDVPLIWAAKHSNWDASMTILSHMLCGPPVKDTLEYLKNTKHTELRDALRCIL